MRGDPKKRQLRRCAVCQKIGHNKSTCPETATPSSLKTTGPKPVPFFVHHVDYSPGHSEHVVNLKNEKTSWKQVGASSPETPHDPWYYFHTPTSEGASPTTPAKSIFATLPRNSEEPNISGGVITQKVAATFAKTDSAVVDSLPPAPRVNAMPRVRATTFNSWLDTIAEKISSAKLIGVRTAVAVIILALCVIAPRGVGAYYEELKQAKTTIMDNGTAGIMALQESAAALTTANFAVASIATSAALDRFNSALSTLRQHELITTLVRIVPVAGSEFVSREKLLLAGQEIALGNSYLIRGMNSATAASSTLTTKIAFVTNELNTALPYYRRARAHLNDVPIEAVPTQYQAQFSDFKKVFNALQDDLENISKLGSSAQEIFGAAGTRRYLVLFQNESEIRPTGGFMGSFALADVKDGKLVKLDIPAGGSYDLQGQLDTYVEPPTPLLLSNKRWEFQDANWFPDFPSSAQKILWFYRHARGVTADGVIAINSSVLERLLTLVGPLTDAKRGLTLTADTAISTLQNVVETGPEKAAHKPKQIIADTAGSLFNALGALPSTATVPLLVNLQTALENKEIQLYFTDESAQKTIAGFGWSGALLPTDKDQDYLMVVNTNIQGQKSDRNIKQSITHEALVQDDGSVVDTVTIKRENTTENTDPIYNQTNIDYIRVYVPAGSTLLSAGGFSWPDESKFRTPENWYKPDTFLSNIETNPVVDRRSGTRITTEFGKTAFGNWVITEPGASSTITFTYKLPFTLFKNNNSLVPSATTPPSYQLMAQKQSGVTSAFASQVIVPAQLRPQRVIGDNAVLAKNGAAFSVDTFTHDMLWALILQPQN